MIHFDNQPTRNSRTPRVFGLVLAFAAIIVVSNVLIGALFG